MPVDKENEVYTKNRILRKLEQIALISLFRIATRN